LYPFAALRKKVEEMYPFVRPIDVVIVSPSDAIKARDAVERECHDWNGVRSAGEGIVFRPRRSDRDGVPIVGLKDAQGIVNDQLIRTSDILFCVFYARLGTPTERAISGTVEEIELMIGLGKPVHIFFSRQSFPNSVDTTQVEALRAFEKRIGELGLVSDYKTLRELSGKVRRCLELDVVRFRDAS
jgi:hypothetical protein